MQLNFSTCLACKCLEAGCAFTLIKLYVFSSLAKWEQLRKLHICACLDQSTKYQPGPVWLGQEPIKLSRLDWDSKLTCSKFQVESFELLKYSLIKPRFFFPFQITTKSNQNLEISEKLDILFKRKFFSIPMTTHKDDEEEEEKSILCVDDVTGEKHHILLSTTTFACLVLPLLAPL